MAYWSAITDLDQLSKWYPDEIHLYTDLVEYVTYNDVVTLDDDDYPVSLTVAATLPLYSLESTTWNFGNIAATLPLLTANGQRGNFASAGVSMPVYTADGFIGSLTGEMAEKLPMFTISAASTQANLVTLTKSLPMYKIAGHAYQYNYGSVDRNLPMMTIGATASVAIIGTLAKTLPRMTVYGEASLTGRFDNIILRHTDDVWGGAAVELPMMTISARVN